jgi:hypothetical protein
MRQRHIRAEKEMRKQKHKLSSQSSDKEQEWEKNHLVFDSSHTTAQRAHRLSRHQKHTKAHPNDSSHATPHTTLLATRPIVIFGYMANPNLR